MLLPLEHLYVPDDHRTCREFDFPVVLSGHDHHRVDETVAGTRLLKVMQRDGIQWNSMKFNGIQWNSMEFNGKPRTGFSGVRSI